MTQVRISAEKAQSPESRSSCAPWRDRLLRSVMVTSTRHFTPTAARPKVRICAISSAAPARLKASTRVGMITSVATLRAATLAAVKLGGQSIRQTS